MKTNSLILIAGLAGVACADPTPANPTWQDVRPIFMANCARCHGFYLDNAAPLTFRLDVMHDSRRDGRKVYGAEAMRTFVVARVIDLGHGLPVMPELSSRQEDMLTLWRNDPLPSPSDAPLEVTVDAPATPVDASVIVTIELDDADGVEGFLQVEGFEDALPEMALHAGTNVFNIDTRSIPDGSYPLNIAGGDLVDVIEAAVATITVAHANGTAPAVRLPPLTDALLTGTVDLVIPVTDPDVGDVLIVDAVLRRGAVDVPMVTTVVAGGFSVAVDVSAVEAGPSWTLVVTATDTAGNVTTRRSGRFVCASGPTPTDFAFADASAIVTVRCGECHKQDAPILDMTTEEQIRPALGAIYRRVVQTREMPPPSAEVLTNDWPMPDEERDSLGEWILGGAP